MENITETLSHSSELHACVIHQPTSCGWKLVDPEPSFLKICRRRGDNLYVVTEAIELAKDTVLCDNSSVTFSANVHVTQVPFVQGEGQGKDQRAATMTVPQGTVMAYRKKKLVIKDRYCSILVIDDTKQKTFQCGIIKKPLQQVQRRKKVKSGQCALERSPGNVHTEEEQQPRAEPSVRPRRKIRRTQSAVEPSPGNVLTEKEQQPGAEPSTQRFSVLHLRKTLTAFKKIFHNAPEEQQELRRGPSGELEPQAAYAHRLSRPHTAPYPFLSAFDNSAEEEQQELRRASSRELEPQGGSSVVFPNEEKEARTGQWVLPVLLCTSRSQWEQPLSLSGPLLSNENVARTGFCRLYKGNPLRDAFVAITLCFDIGPQVIMRACGHRIGQIEKSWTENAEEEFVEVTPLRLTPVWAQSGAGFCGRLSADLHYVSDNSSEEKQQELRRGSSAQFHAGLRPRIAPLASLNLSDNSEEEDEEEEEPSCGSFGELGPHGAQHTVQWGPLTARDVQYLCVNFLEEEQPEQRTAPSSFSFLEEEISENVEALAQVSKDRRDAILHSFLAILGDREALKKLMDMWEMETLGHLDGPGGKILDELRQRSSPTWINLEYLIFYLLEVLMVLSDTQLVLLVQSVEKRLLSQQRELVRGILEPNFKYSQHTPFTVQAEHLAQLQGEGLHITCALLEECGLKMELESSQSTWHPEAKMPLSALYGALSLLLQLAEA
ncbi:uncharacterized protein LOC101560879 [Octodon degus]|uniref:Uncharacterized protein LOC101560879 n=1 Tax=Octodon degus TaxID=10160 RepID=A0A6P6EQH5_OCTDE|nr:uncharacterized protein LOC101560879 [Octodon degus]